MLENDSNDYVIRVLASPLEVDGATWNALLAAQPQPTPFMRHEYLAALHTSGCAVPATGWTPRFITVWQGGQLAAACPLYLKIHSHGEYVFDWAWANAYAQHGLAYYPKALVAVPFTPVPGTRLLARDATARQALVQTLLDWCHAEKLSSLHLLFGADEDLAACAQAGLMQRDTVQFHWTNMAPTLATSCASLPPEGAHFALGRPGGEIGIPTLATSCASLPPEGAHFALGRPGGEIGIPTLATSCASLALQAATPPEPASLRAVPPCTGRPGAAALSPEGAHFALGRPGAEIGHPRPFGSFDHFLASLNQEKRKKIRQERRKVADAGVRFRWARGNDISPSDWDFFYRCYERTYLEHGNAPYLSRGFFRQMAQDMPENWLLFVGERAGRPMASSLIALHDPLTLGSGQNHSKNILETADEGLSHPDGSETVAYGRYWGALERVDCLHFEACYYQPLQWCIAHGIHRFEGGAQGEHKMARALLPVKTSSAHWLAHPSFADAVERFLEREGHGVGEYLEHLQARSPLRKPAAG